MFLGWKLVDVDGRVGYGWRMFEIVGGCWLMIVYVSGPWISLDDVGWCWAVKYTIPEWDPETKNYADLGHSTKWRIVHCCKGQVDSLASPLVIDSNAD